MTHRLLFFDTETTGLPDRSRPLDHASQPHLVQVAACLADADGRVWGSLSLIVYPSAWEIPERAAAVHGITSDIARKVGVGEDSATMALTDLARCADLIVAHNLDFDRRIIMTAILRTQPQSADWWGRLKGYCTMQAARPVCKLPPTDRQRMAGFTDYKSPTLAEAHQILCGEPLALAHEAQADMRACRAIWKALQEQAA